MTSKIFKSMLAVSLLNFLLCLAYLMGMPGTILIISACAVLVLSVFLSSALSKKIVKPINEIDPEKPDAVKSYPEISPLLRRISRQNELISKQMDELQRRQREFVAITDSMSEGFLLIDSHMNILSYNSSALRLLGAADFSDSADALCLYNSEIFRTVAEEALSGQHGSHTADISGAVYQILASPVENQGAVCGAVIVALDITEKARRDALRHDFSSNVSHELKTPLTSIYGISEMIMSGLVKPADIQKFAKNIHDESGRLITLINDIIRLSQLDDSSFPLSKEPVDLYVVAQMAVSSLDTVARERGVKISLLGRHLTVSGIPSVISEMIYNLCDNAIKYNKNDGSVTVTVFESDGHVSISVEDTGIGIPSEHQSRIFERFYRVDKSHSREIGGTGLGLSIVKHGAQFHGADVSLNSVVGEGTAVTITFP